MRLTEAEAGALAFVLNKTPHGYERIKVVERGAESFITVENRAGVTVAWYPSASSQLSDDACSGLFLRALAALGYAVRPCFEPRGTASVDGPVWFLDLHGFGRDTTYGPDLLPLLANALIAAAPQGEITPDARP